MPIQLSDLGPFARAQVLAEGRATRRPAPKKASRRAAKPAVSAVAYVDNEITWANRILYVLKITLPMPPSTNRIWRTANGHTYRSADYKAFLARVGEVCEAAHLTPTDQPVEMTMRFYMARKNGDASNRIKALEDSLIGFIYKDDLQVVRGHYERHMDTKNPRVEIEVRAMKHE